MTRPADARIRVTTVDAVEIKQWWPRLSFESRQHLKRNLRQPLDARAHDALLAAGVLPTASPAHPDAPVLSLSDDEWTWIQHHG